MSKKFAKLLAAFACGITLLVFAGIQDVEARRLGGGKSFGSSSIYSSPYKRSVKPAGNTATSGQNFARQQNAQRGAELSKRGGLMGMLGGLALGGLLGALLFGGAFENLNLFDLVIFGLIAFVLYKIFVRRRAAPVAMHRSGYGPGPGASTMGSGGSASVSAEDDARGKGVLLPPDAMSGSEAAGRVEEVPPGFSSVEFLEKAKMTYRRLQQAWDTGDSSFLQEFTSSSVFTELQRQLAEREGENKTDILSLGAELLEVRRSNDQYEAAVLFDAFLREVDTDSTGGRGQQVREVWHFVQSVHAQRPTWYLDGIRQLEI